MKSILIAIGMLITIGTAGSADLNIISLTQIIIQLIIGLTLMFAGMACNKGNARNRG